jgi:hypothetical protein
VYPTFRKKTCIDDHLDPLKHRSFLIFHKLHNTVIRLQRIHNFWCSMLIFTPFA